MKLMAFVKEVSEKILTGHNRHIAMAGLGAFVRPLASEATHRHHVNMTQGCRWDDRGSFEITSNSSICGWMSAVICDWMGTAPSSPHPHVVWELHSTHTLNVHHSTGRKTSECILGLMRMAIQYAQSLYTGTRAIRCLMEFLAENICKIAYMPPLYACVENQRDKKGEYKPITSICGIRIMQILENYNQKNGNFYTHVRVFLMYVWMYMQKIYLFPSL